MGIKKIKGAPLSSSERDIELRMITYVENNRYFDFSDDLDGSRFESYKRVYNHVVTNLNLDQERADKWWDWGTKSGFTII